MPRKAKTPAPPAPAQKQPSIAMLARAREQQVLRLYAAGKTPDEIGMELHLRPKEVNADIIAATERLIAHYTCPPEHTFVRYAVFNLGIVRKLQRLIERFNRDKKTVQYNAAISALRAQSDIYDRVLAKGLEFGVIERKQASAAAKSVKDTDSLRQLIKREVLALSTLLDEVDMSVEFHHRRQRLSLKAARLREEQARTWYPIIIKPLIGPHGVIRSIPDWKYAKRAYVRRAEGGGLSVSPSRLPPEQHARFLAAQDIRRLTTELEQEQPDNRTSPPAPLPEQLEPALPQLPPRKRRLPSLPSSPQQQQPSPTLASSPQQPTQDRQASWLSTPTLPPSMQDKHEHE